MTNATTTQSASPTSTLVPVDRETSILALAQLLPIDGWGLCDGVAPYEYAVNILRGLADERNIVLSWPADGPKPGSDAWYDELAAKYAAYLQLDYSHRELFGAIRDSAEVREYYGSASMQRPARPSYDAAFRHMAEQYRIATSAN